MLFSLSYLSVLIFARLAKNFSQRRKLSASLSASVGSLFIWFGGKLAAASL